MSMYGIDYSKIVMVDIDWVEGEVEDSEVIWSLSEHDENPPVGSHDLCIELQEWWKDEDDEDAEDEDDEEKPEGPQHTLTGVVEIHQGDDNYITVDRVGFFECSPETIADWAVERIDAWAVGEEHRAEVLADVNKFFLEWKKDSAKVAENVA